MNKNLLVILSTTFVTLSVLQGCATTQHSRIEQKINIDQEILDSTTKIMRAQATLYNASALNNERMKLPVWIDGDQKVTVSWYGDAHELFSELAKAKSKKFTTSGVQQPLPVVLNVRDTEYSTIINLLQSQLSYRAVVTENETGINLKYNEPKKQGE